MATTSSNTASVATHENSSINTGVSNSATKDPFIDQPTRTETTSRQEIREVANITEEAPRGTYYSLIGDNNIQNIDNVLTSWQYMKNASWTTTLSPPPVIAQPSDDVSDSTHQLFELALPTDFINQDLVKSKINYFKYMKCDFVAQLKVNASPQQQGMLFMFYEPMRNLNEDEFGYKPTSGSWAKRGIKSLGQITSFKGVYLNIEETDTVELKIPYLYYKDYFDVTISEEIGILRVICIAPLRGASTAEEVEVVLNVRADRVRLRVPTPEAVGEGATSTMVGETQVEEREFCCPLQCFPIPSVQFDGKSACCNHYSYCVCRCKTFSNRPSEFDIMRKSFITPSAWPPINYMMALNEDRKLTRVTYKTTEIKTKWGPYYQTKAKTTHENGSVYTGLGEHFVRQASKFNACQEIYYRIYGQPDEDSEPEYDTVDGETQIDDTKQKQPGLISNIANKVANIAGIISYIPFPVPLVKSVATGVSWGARLLGTLSAAMGFSKPDTLESVRFVARYPAFGAQQIDGITPGLSLGAIQDNSVEHPDQGADEMTFANLCSKPTIIESKEITIPGFNTKGTIWTTFKVHPIPDEYTYPLDANHNTVYGGPMQVLATCFNYWRGELVYKFRLVKTKFVKGRLQISFLPTRLDSNTVSNINKTYTKIWDVGVDTEFEFTVPWILPYGYERLHDDGHLGYLQVSVFNKFNYPENVSDKIQLVTSLCCPSMEFAIPTMGTRAALDADLLPNDVSVLSGDGDVPMMHGETQMKFDTRFELMDLASSLERTRRVTLRNLFRFRPVGTLQNEVFRDLLANLTAMEETLDELTVKVAEDDWEDGEVQYEEKFNISDASTRLIGEKITNLRQLLKKHGKQDNGSVHTYDGNTNWTLLQMFALYRGSFKWLLTNTTADRVRPSLTDNSFNFDYPFFLNSDNASYITVPYYSKFPARPTNVEPTYMTIRNGTTTATADRYLAIGDDFSAWGLVAPPIVVHYIGI